MTPIKSVVQVDGLSRPGTAFSTALVCAPGRLLFVSGLLARARDGAIAGKGDVAAQTRAICEALQQVAHAAGGSLASIVRLDVYVTDVGDREKIYAVRREFFPDEPPTSTMLQVAGFVHPDALIEISAIGVLP